MVPLGKGDKSFAQKVEQTTLVIPAKESIPPPHLDTRFRRYDGVEAETAVSRWGGGLSGAGGVQYNAATSELGDG